MVGTRHTEYISCMSISNVRMKQCIRAVPKNTFNRLLPTTHYRSFRWTGLHLLILLFLEKTQNGHPFQVLILGAYRSLIFSYNANYRVFDYKNRVTMIPSIGQGVTIVTIMWSKRNCEQNNQNKTITDIYNIEVEVEKI